MTDPTQAQAEGEELNRIRDVLAKRFWDEVEARHFAGPAMSWEEAQRLLLVAIQQAVAHCKQLAHIASDALSRRAPPAAAGREEIERALRNHVHFNLASGSREVDYDGAVSAILAMIDLPMSGSPTHEEVEVIKFFRVMASRWRGIACAMGYEPRAHKEVIPSEPWLVERINKYRKQAALEYAPPAAAGEGAGREELRRAYEQGCIDTHKSIQAEPELALMPVEAAEFGEAADDYAASALLPPPAADGSHSYEDGYAQACKNSASDKKWMTDKAWMDAVCMFTHYETKASQIWIVGAEQAATRRDEWLGRMRALAATRNAEEIAALTKMPAAEGGLVEALEAFVSYAAGHVLPRGLLPVLDKAKAALAALAAHARQGHASDCAVHNAPALPPGPCDCGADPAQAGGGVG